MSRLFDSVSLGPVRLRNRIGMSPMSMYAADNGVTGSFDVTHYGARAVGGSGLIITGTVAVAEEGRITPKDPGLWLDDQVEPLKAVADTIRAGGAVPGIQIGHAGRKASLSVPWQGGPPRGDGRQLSLDEGGWRVVAPSAIPYGGDKPATPLAMNEDQIWEAVRAFADAAHRADRAGFEVLEIHGSHGYLIHSFQSPLTNQRSDQWGGSTANRNRFGWEVIKAVRAVWPRNKALLFRLTMEDFIGGGLQLDDAVEFARKAKSLGIDLFDLMSFGAISPDAKAPWERNFTTEHARALRAALPGVSIAGSAQTNPEFDTDPAKVDGLIQDGTFDLILLGRQLLADPYWPASAARILKDERLLLPSQYEHWLTGRNPDSIVPAA